MRCRHESRKHWTGSRRRIWHDGDNLHESLEVGASACSARHTREPIPTDRDPTRKCFCALPAFSSGKPTAFPRDPPELSVQGHVLVHGRRSALPFLPNILLGAQAPFCVKRQERKDKQGKPNRSGGLALAPAGLIHQHPCRSPFQALRSICPRKVRQAAFPVSS